MDQEEKEGKSEKEFRAVPSTTAPLLVLISFNVI